MLRARPGGSRKPEGGRARATLLIGSLALLVAIAATLYVLREPAPLTGGTPDAAPSPPIEEPIAANGAGAVGASDSAAERNPSEPAPRIADADPNAAFRGLGRVKLHVVDADDGAPIADLPFVAMSERPYFHVFARGVTDKRGEAEVGTLPEDVIILETMRRPPHANSVTAVWLSRHQRRDVELRVGRGGTLRGRVVDDAGAPLEGVKVTIDPRPGPQAVHEMKAVQESAPEVAAHFARTEEVISQTDAFGRYEVDALLSRPSAIWIVKDRMQPEREDAASLVFRKDAQMQWTSAPLREGEAKQLPDVVFERGRVFAGRVLDSEGAPVSGALVTTRDERGLAFKNERTFAGPNAEDAFVSRVFRTMTPEEHVAWRTAPWESGFRLAPGEAMTGAGGLFELATTGPARGVLVATESGTKQDFALPATPPGRRSDGIELRLKAECHLWLEVTDEKGKPLDACDATGRPRVLYVEARLGELARLSGSARAVEAGRFAATVPIRASRIRELVVYADFFDRTTRNVEGRLHDGDVVTLRLARKSEFKLRIRPRFASDEDAALVKSAMAAGRAGIEFLACLAEPDRRRSSRFVGCCGVGGSKRFDPAKDGEVELSVRCDAPYWIYVHGPFGEAENAWTEVALERLAPGPAMHEVKLPALGATWRAGLAETKLKESEKKEPDAPRPKPGRLTVVVADATTHAPLPNALLAVRRSLPAAPEHTVTTHSGVEKAGPIELQGLEPGEYRWRVVAADHATSAEQVVTVAEGESSDLGTVELETLSPWRARVVDPDGAPIAGATVSLQFDSKLAVDPRTDSSSSSMYGKTDAEGTVAFTVSLPERFPLSIHPPAAPDDADPEALVWNGATTRAQIVEVARGSPAEVHELRVQRWQRVRVDVDLSAFADALGESQLGIELRPEGETAEPDEFRWLCRHPIATGDGRARTFLFRVPAGRFEVLSFGMLYRIDATTIEVRDLQPQGVQQFGLVAH